MTLTKILYLQLPLLDNDVKTARENFLFAGAYLDHALRQSEEAPFYGSMFAPLAWDELDSGHLVEAIVESGCEIICCTVYLWNIERTLRLAALLKARRATLRIGVGGPEAAKGHPLLFSDNSPLDAVVVGEGEALFPALLCYWRTGAPADYQSLALFESGAWRWGQQEAPAVDLVAAQPGEEAIMACVQHRPVVYLETVRGCPLTCSYCRYYQLHTGLRVMESEQVLDRIARFRELGAKEIRFVDPTFNARPRFTEFLEQIAALNADHQLAFFAELRADTLTARQAELMQRARFTAVEVGVQSMDREVLKNVARPLRLDKTEAGIRHLCDAGVQVVLDIMYGLPGQTLAEVRRSLEWALGFGDAVQVQCMQTLVLPGTVLRAEASRWGFDHEENPPYGVRKTADLSPGDIVELERFLDEHPGLPADPVTPRFCGQRLTGLFREQCRMGLHDLKGPLPGRGNRRALLIQGEDLFLHQAALNELVRRAITTEPDGLWQFVLIPAEEEPLDLLEALATTICGQPPHLLDRFASASAFGVVVSRRLYVRSNKKISQAWSEAAEALLRQFFG